MGLGHAREREKDEAGRDHAFPIHPRVRESGDRDAIALPPGRLGFHQMRSPNQPNAIWRAAGREGAAMRLFAILC